MICFMLIGGEYSYHLSSYLITQVPFVYSVGGQSLSPEYDPGGRRQPYLIPRELYINKRLGVRGEIIQYDNDEGGVIVD